MKTVAKIVSMPLAWAAVGISSALAQTSTTTPGVPNTGAGGDIVTNFLLLGISAAIVAVGVVYLVHARAKKTE